MLSFLNHFFKGSEKTNIRDNNTKKVIYSKYNSTCSHIKKVRVLEMGEKMMKIFVGKYTLNRLSVMTKTGRELFLHEKESTHCL